MCGDVCVTLYHARSTLGGIGGRAHGIKICHFQLHTGFVPEEETLLSYGRHDLDEMTELDHFLTNFNVSMSILVGDIEKPPSVAPPWTTSKCRTRNPKILFGSDLEYQENIENFVTAPVSRPPPPQKSPLPSRPPPPVRPAPPSPMVQPKNTENHNIKPDLVQNTTDADRNAQVDVPESTFDLLNLNQNTENKSNTFHEQQTRPAPETATQRNMSFDLLGFGKTEEVNTESRNNSNTGNPIDLLGNISSTSSTNLLGNLNLDLNSMNINSNNAEQKTFDPFETLLQPTKSQPQSHNSPENSQASGLPPPSNTDPFADLGSFVSSNLSGNSNQAKSSPINQPQNFFNAQPQQPKVLPTPSPVASSHTTPTHQNRAAQDNFGMSNSAPQKPDYNRSNFVDPKDNSKAGGNNKPAGGFGDIFADILGEQGYSFGNKMQQPRTINDMRKEDIVKDMDPDRLKIMEWVRMFLLFL